MVLTLEFTVSADLQSVLCVLSNRFIKQRRNESPWALPEMWKSQAVRNFLLCQNAFAGGKVARLLVLAHVYRTDKKCYRKRVNKTKTIFPSLCHCFFKTVHLFIEAKVTHVMHTRPLCCRCNQEQQIGANEIKRKATNYANKPVCRFEAFLADIFLSFVQAQQMPHIFQFFHIISDGQKKG